MRNLLLTSMLATGIAAMAAAPAVSTFVPANHHKSLASVMNQRNQAPARLDLRTHQGTPMKAAAVKRVITDTPPTTMPEGPAEELPRQLLSKSGTGFMDMWVYIYHQPNDGSATYVVYDNDKVYVKNPWSLTASDAWLIGTKDGSKVTFEFPQVAYSYTYDYDNYTLYDYFALAEETEVEQDGQKYKTYNVAEQQSLTFTLGEDGTLINDSPELLLADVYQLPNEESGELEWFWAGGGDLITALTPVNETAAQLPEGAVTEDMVLIANDWGYESKMAIVGDKCYLAGIAQFSDPSFKDVYVVGDVKDGKISFPSGQYLGVDENLHFINYMIGGTSEQVFDPDDNEYYDDFKQKEALVFDYDAEKKTLVTEEAVALCSTPEFKMLYLNIANGLEVMSSNPDAKIEKLRDPVAAFYPAEVDENGNPVSYAELDFIFSNVSADGALLDMEKLFFQLAFDDELYEFYPEDYSVIEEATDAMPVGASDGRTIVCQGNQQAMLIFPEGFETLKLRFMYKQAEDAEPIYSEWVTCYNNSGVEGVEGVAADRVSSSFIDMQGRRVANPVSGLYIRADKMSDGSTVFSKVMVR